MEKFSSWIVHHKVTRMAITHTKNVSCDTLASQGTKESAVVVFESQLDFCFGGCFRKHGLFCLVLHEKLHD